MAKLVAVVVFSLFFDLQVVVSSKERTRNYETVQNVAVPIAEVVHEGRGSDSQEESREPQSDARWDQAVNALP